MIVSGHNELIIDGEAYSFDHLDATNIVLEGHGRDGADIRVRISYLSHVFSRTPGAQEAPNFKDENDKNRVFCSDRYRCSISLPAYCNQSIENNFLTWESKDRNSVSSYMLVDDGDGNSYAIVYRLTPSKTDRYDVEFIVKSAYLKDPIPKNPRKHNVRSLVKKCYFEDKSLP